MEANRETTLLEYKKPLVEIDILRYAEEAAEIENSISELENEKKGVIAKFTGKIKDKTARRVHLMSCIHSREETVEEECYWEYDYDQGVVFYYSVNTSECVYSRPITNEERQLELFRKEQGEEKK